MRVRIEGRVQGVWFRAWTIERAHALGLDGWVRNRLDGSVEGLFAGRAEAVTAMLTACWEGPTGARVRSVREEPADAPGERGFHQLPTG